MDRRKRTTGLGDYRGQGANTRVGAEGRVVLDLQPKNKNFLRPSVPQYPRPEDPTLNFIEFHLIPLNFNNYTTSVCQVRKRGSLCGLTRFDPDLTRSDPINFGSAGTFLFVFRSGVRICVDGRDG